MNHVEVLVTPDRLTAIRERMLEYLGECSATWRKWNRFGSGKFWKCQRASEVKRIIQGSKPRRLNGRNLQEWEDNSSRQDVGAFELLPESHHSFNML